MSVDDVATDKRVTPRTVYSWLQRGIAPTHERHFGRVFFDRAAVAAFTVPVRGKRKHGK